MPAEPTSSLKLSQRDLSRWRLVEDFQARLGQAAQGQALGATWSAPGRQLGYAEYF